MTTKNNQLRFDSNDRYFLTQQLESKDPAKYYHAVPGIVGRKILPPIENVSPDLPVYGWTMTQLLGKTQVRGPKSRTAPTAKVVRTEETAQILTLEEEFGWTVDAVRAARATNQDLPEDTRLAAVTQIEQRIDAMLATGNPVSKVYGVANNPAVLNTNAAGVWTAATSTAILNDFAAWLEDAASALKQAQLPGQDGNVPMFDQFTVIMSAARYRRLSMMKLGDNESTTVLKYIRENFEMIKRITPWWRLDTAAAGSPMAVLAPALDNGAINPMAGGALLPLDYEQLPEQYEGRNVIVPCAGKCGGFVTRHAVAFRTLKGI